MSDHYDDLLNTSGHRILPSEVDEPDLTEIGPGRIDIVKRDNRSKYKETPQDSIELAPGTDQNLQLRVDPGDDLDVPFEAAYDLGSEVVFVLTTKNQQGIFEPDTSRSNHLQVITSSQTDDTIIFPDLDKNAYAFYAFIRNDEGYRVSNLTRQRIQMKAERDKRSDTPSYLESGSPLETQKNQQDQAGHERYGLQELSDAVRDIAKLYHDDLQAVENHVDALVGLDYDPLTWQQVLNAPGLDSFSRLFPEEYRDMKPKYENADFMQGNFTVDSEGEYGRLEEAQTHLNTCYETLPSRSYDDWTTQSCSTTDDQGNTVSGQEPVDVTVYNETAEEYITYGSESAIQDRLDEIEALINGGTLQTGDAVDGFNNGATDHLFSRRYFWINQWANRKDGYGSRLKRQQNGSGQVDDQVEKTGTMIDEVGP